MNWNHDISTAPRGKTVTVTRTIKDKQREVEEYRREYILAVHPDGMVAQSYWIPPRYTQGGNLLEGNRWSGFNLGSDPIAWAPWPTYESVAKASGEQTERTTGYEGAGSRREMRVGEAPARVSATSDDGRDSVERHAPISQEAASEQPQAHGSSPCIGPREGQRPATYGQLVTAGETAPIFFHEVMNLDDCGSGDLGFDVV